MFHFQLNKLIKRNNVSIKIKRKFLKINFLSFFNLFFQLQQFNLLKGHYALYDSTMKYASCVSSNEIFIKIQFIITE